MSEKAYIKLTRRQAETVVEVLEADLAGSEPDEEDRDAVESSIRHIRGALRRLDYKVEMKHREGAS